eukprot:scaffold32007_cov101-Isochrysis_galbana.AAC.1
MAPPTAAQMPMVSLRARAANGSSVLVPRGATEPSCSSSSTAATRVSTPAPRSPGFRWASSIASASGRRVSCSLAPAGRMSITAAAPTARSNSASASRAPGASTRASAATKPAGPALSASSTRTAPAGIGAHAEGAAERAAQVGHFDTAARHPSHRRPPHARLSGNPSSWLLGAVGVQHFPQQLRPARADGPAHAEGGRAGGPHLGWGDEPAVGAVGQHRGAGPAGRALSGRVDRHQSEAVRGVGTAVHHSVGGRPPLTPGRDQNAEAGVARAARAESGQQQVDAVARTRAGRVERGHFEGGGRRGGGRVCEHEQRFRRKPQAGRAPTAYRQAVVSSRGQPGHLRGVCVGAYVEHNRIGRAVQPGSAHLVPGGGGGGKRQGCPRA